MTTADKTPESDSTAVGRVVAVYEKARAISADGMERDLVVDSPIFAHDTIVTEGSGRVSLVIEENPQTQIDLDGMSKVIIDEDIFGGTSPEEITENVAEIELLQESFLVEGVDLSVQESSAGDEVADEGDIRFSTDHNRPSSRGDISAGADNVTVIFDQSDYDDPDNYFAPLDNLIDPEDTSS